MISPQASQILALVRTLRLDLTNEKRTQVGLQEALERAGIVAQREVQLGDGDIVDFMVGNIAIEMKLKGQRRAILDQLERYARHGDVHEIILLTARCMTLPAHIGGKPAAVGSLSQGWL